MHFFERRNVSCHLSEIHTVLILSSENEEINNANTESGGLFAFGEIVFFGIEVPADGSHYDTPQSENHLPCVISQSLDFSS